MARGTKAAGDPNAGTSANRVARKRVAKKTIPVLDDPVRDVPAPGIDTSARDSYALYPSQLVIVSSAELAGEATQWAHLQRAQDATRTRSVILRELLDAGLKVMRPRYERKYGTLAADALADAIENERTHGARAKRAARMTRPATSA